MQEQQMVMAVLFHPVKQCRFILFRIFMSGAFVLPAPLFQDAKIFSLIIRCHFGRHETALYHFGTDHAECNVHIIRYLRKNTEETGNRWSDSHISFFQGFDYGHDGAVHFMAACLPESSRHFLPVLRFPQIPF